MVTCNAKWIQYNERSWNLWSLGPTSTATLTDSYAESQGACRTSTFPESYSDTHTGQVTTLCDGIPRALGPRESVTEYFPGTGPCSTTFMTYTDVTEYYREPKPSPTCSLNTKVCIPVWSTYSALSSSYSSAHPTPTDGDTASPIRPSSCPRQTIIDPCTACHWNAEWATIYYWPVTTAGGDLCKQYGTTVPPTGPSTAVVDGKTLTSPNIYISFATISAWANNHVGPASQCGDTHTSTMIAVDPKDVSSVRSHRNGEYPHMGTAYPFNFAEYQPHAVGNYTMSLIPWEQYKGGRQCPLFHDPSCTMIRDNYYPWLQLPEEVRRIDPKWTACDRKWELPVATLVPLASQGAEPTHTHATPTVSPGPHSSAVPPTATPTN